MAPAFLSESQLALVLGCSTNFQLSKRCAMQIKDGFRAMGARVKITEIQDHDRASRPGLWREDSPVVIDIRDDGGGEFFKLAHRRDVELEVLDADPQDRHLLLVAHAPDAGRQAGKTSTAAFL